MLLEPIATQFYRNKHVRFENICPWLTMEDQGIIRLKNDAICCAYEYTAPDLGSSSISKINSISGMLNNSIIQLGDGWTIQFELQRHRTNTYPGANFSNFGAYCVERQREYNFYNGVEHYINRYYLIFTYKLPNQINSNIKSKIYKKESDNEIFNRNNYLRNFRMNTAKIVNILSTIMYVRKLNSSELLTLCHSSVSLKEQELYYPENDEDGTYSFIDVCDMDLENSMPLRLGNYYIPIVTIKDFPSATLPAMFDAINKSDCELRFSTRYICLSKQEALKRIEIIEKKSHSARKSIGQLIMESTMHTVSTRENSAAIAEESDASTAKVEVTMGNLGYGQYSSMIMVWDKDYERAMEKAEYIDGIVSSCGFTVKQETMNSLQSFLSMQPGNIFANRRRYFLSTANVSHIVPVSSIWSGEKENKFMKNICGIGTPHVICDTDFGIPFYLNLNVRDVGHTWISGKTGAGKSTLLALLEAQWLKYPDAQVIIFDKDRSARNLTMCTGGMYIEPGKDETTFQPLAEIDTLEGQQWAVEFIEILLAEQHVEITPGMRKAIFDTIKTLSTKEPQMRTLTSFQQYCHYQDPKTSRNDVYDGLSPYVLDGQYGSLFDSDVSNISISKWTMIEMGTLMNMAQAAVAPALDYLFMQCEKKFDGRPTILVLDEAWIFFKNPIFARKIVEWLKVLRKKHVFVIFATQELDDAINSEIASTLVSQCVTKIFLADEEALTPLNYEAYRKFGLENSEIELLSRMRKKMDYFYKSPLGTRRFQLGLDEIQLAILTCSIEDQEMLNRLEDKYGKNSGKQLVKIILNEKGYDIRDL